jgi:type I restriction enzyme M protein
MLGVIFRKAQNRIQDPAKLRRLIVELIDKEEWSSLDADVKGDAYEGLLQKNAEDVKGGAGQYFTPRPLIAAIVDAIAPQPGQTICDPACGTGGFLLAAHNYLSKHHQLDRAQKKKLKSGTLFGVELVDPVTRLCAMNLLLHGIGGESDTEMPVVTKDALAGKHGEYEIVLANPPFGKKSSVTIVNDAGETSKESLTINRDDFWASTSNKQLNFLQHIFTLKENTLKRSDLDDFVACYQQKNRAERKESERFKSFTYDELTKRDKANLDIFWLKDDALEESANLPAPEIIARETTDDLEAALEQFATIADDLERRE